MNYRILKPALLACAVIVAAMGLGGCKENTVISSNVTPAIDNITTFQVTLPESFYEATTVRDDSVITSDKYSSVYQALGWVQDGTANTAAGIYMQVVPKTTGFKIPDGETIDSAFVILPYGGFTWGDTLNNSSYTINAYEVTEPLSKDSSYYPFTKKATGNLIGTGTMRVGPRGSGVITDSVALAGGNVAPHLRVRLNSTIIDKIDKALDTNTAFTGFLSAFAGVYLAPDTSVSGRALPYFIIDGTVGNYIGANILIHTHNSTRDTAYSLPYNPTYGARYNRISRNYSPDVNTFSPTSPWLTMQNQPGAAIDFRFRNLDQQTIIPRNSVINKVEIIFTKKSDPAVDRYFFPPARIFPQAISKDSVRYTILDRLPVSDQTRFNFIDGTPRDSGGLTHYTLNIPREFQLAVSTGQTGLHLLIGGTVTYSAAYRLLLGSLSNPDPAYRPVVKVIYSKQN